jgi:phosphatidylserine synthase
MHMLTCKRGSRCCSKICWIAGATHNISTVPKLLKYTRLIVKLYPYGVCYRGLPVVCAATCTIGIMLAQQRLQALQDRLLPGKLLTTTPLPWVVAFLVATSCLGVTSLKQAQPWTHCASDAQLAVLAWAQSAAAACSLSSSWSLQALWKGGKHGCSTVA